jgi:hypothetical protein
MRGRRFYLTTLAFGLFTLGWAGVAFAQIEQAVIQIEGAMQCTI